MSHQFVNNLLCADDVGLVGTTNCCEQSWPHDQYR